MTASNRAQLAVQGYMYLSIGFPRTITWLLAATMAVQPLPGFSCGCGAVSADAAKRPAKQSCCCSGTADRSATDGKPRRACCAHHANREDRPSRACACHCGSGAPTAPLPVSAQRGLSDDWAAPVLYTYAAAIDAPVVHRRDWAFGLLTEWASASEQCIALCRLRF
jgi:hypothetical protein